MLNDQSSVKIQGNRAKDGASWHAGRSSWLTVNNLGDCKVHDSSDGSDGLVLCQIEGAHGKVAGVIIRHSERHVQTGHVVNLAWTLQG